MFTLLAVIGRKWERFYHMYDSFFNWFSFLYDWKSCLFTLDCVSKINKWLLALLHHSPLARISIFFLIKHVSFQRETRVITIIESCKKTWSDFIFIFSIVLVIMNWTMTRDVSLREQLFFFLFLLFLQEQQKWSNDVSSHTILLVRIIVPVECVAQRREVHQFVQSDILHSVFVLAPAIDQPSLYKCNVVRPWKISRNSIVVCIRFPWCKNT